MCRLYGFRSSVTSRVHRSLVDAENALARQSERHRDGWGLAYYIGRFPHLIRNDQQALTDGLFADLSAVVATRTFVAHIRQATVGEVSVLNCHPFQHGAWILAHNGEIAGFGRDAELRREIMNAVDERFRGGILGRTDSEVLFHLFLSRLARQVDDIQDLGVDAGRALAALSETVETVLEICRRYGRDGDCRLTVLLTNGSVMVGYRHRRELFFSTYKTHCPDRESCHAFDATRCEQPPRDGIVKHLIVASERLSDTGHVWQELADGEFVAVDHLMRVQRGRLGATADYEI
ncbi:MAG: class II glutamine amidotransferase [Deltaproteobacteria bacterium]|nr:class II glutamine amidotransferase [Deltaproteobacteria bacterium]